MTITYTYDSLNRLASATRSDSPRGKQDGGWRSLEPRPGGFVQTNFAWTHGHILLASPFRHDR